MTEREYISVMADFLPDGTVRPVSVRLADGPAYQISHVLDVVRMSATKHNGSETRFYVRINGKDHYLYFEDAGNGRPPRWFVIIHDKSGKGMYNRCVTA